jgi:hypothetical protein
MTTIRQHVSFDYLNLVYDNGLDLSSILSINYIGDILKQLTHDMRNISRCTTMFNKLECVTEEHIKSFYENSYGRDDTKFIGLFIAVKMIIVNETNLEKGNYNSMFKRLLNFIANDGKESQLYNQLLFIIMDKLDYSKFDDGIYSLIKYAVYFGNDDIKNFVKGKASKFHKVKESYDELCKNYEKYLVLNGKKKENVPTSASLNSDFEYAIADSLF